MLTYENSPALRSAALAFCGLESTTKFPSAVGLAMWATESAWGTKLTGDFNYFGIIRAPDAGPAKFCPTHEDVTLQQLAQFRPDEQANVTGKTPLANGVYRVELSRWFASYASLQDACAHYVALFISSPKRYEAAWSRFITDHDADALLKDICEAGYATGPAEAVELSIAHQSNILHAIQMGRQEMNGPQIPPDARG